MTKKGFYAVIDGCDGIGKGEALKGIIAFEKSLGKIVFDLHDYWKVESEKVQGRFVKNHDKYPVIGLDFPACIDLLVTAEPTYCQKGKQIRDVIINKNSAQKFSAYETAEAYSEDRHNCLKTTDLPALKNGVNVLKSRSITSSLVYQPVQAQELGESLSIDQLLSCLFPGNQFTMTSAVPNLLIIGIIENPQECIERLKAREKKDNSIFDNLNYQLKFMERFKSDWLKQLFESKGCVVKCFDAGISEEETRKQAVEIWKSEIRKDPFL